MKSNIIVVFTVKKKKTEHLLLSLETDRDTSVAGALSYTHL